MQFIIVLTDRRVGYVSILASSLRFNLNLHALHESSGQVVGDDIVHVFKVDGCFDKKFVSVAPKLILAWEPFSFSEVDCSM